MRITSKVHLRKLKTWIPKLTSDIDEEEWRAIMNIEPDLNVLNKPITECYNPKCTKKDELRNVRNRNRGVVIVTWYKIIAVDCNKNICSSCELFLLPPFHEEKLILIRDNLLITHDIFMKVQNLI